MKFFILTDQKEFIMLAVPADILKLYNALLAQSSEPEKYHPYYRKWLRYYLDFCRKYRYPDPVDWAFLFGMQRA